MSNPCLSPANIPHFKTLLALEKHIQREEIFPDVVSGSSECRAERYEGPGFYFNDTLFVHDNVGEEKCRIPSPLGLVEPFQPISNGIRSLWRGPMFLSSASCPPEDWYSGLLIGIEVWAEYGEIEARARLFDLPSIVNVEHWLHWGAMTEEWGPKEWDDRHRDIQRDCRRSRPNGPDL